MVKNKIIIEMDDREPECQLMADVSSLDLVFERKRLDVGDFRYKELIVERKTIDDLCASILDGRIKTQVEKMKASGNHNYIFIIGSVQRRSSEIDENCVLGKIMSLIVKHNMKIVMCDDEMQFLWLLQNLCEKYDKIKEEETKVVKEEQSIELKGGVENEKD